MRTRAAAVLAFATCVALALVSAASAAAPDAPEQATPPPPQEAPSPELEQSKQATLRLMREGKFSEALDPAQKALALSETIFGAQSIETAVAAHNLGFLLKRLDRLAEARSNLERALAIYDAKLPAVHEDLRNIVGELGLMYQDEGRSDDVVRIYTGLIARAEREGFAAHIGTAHHHNNLAFVLRGMKAFDESLTHWQRAADIYSQQPALDSKSYLLAITALLDSFKKSADYGKAQTLAEQTFPVLTRLGQFNAKTVTPVYLALSEIGNAAGRFPESRTWAKKAISEIEALPEAERGALPDALNSLARTERAVANYEEAEIHFKRALELTQAQGKTANAGILSDNLAVLYASMGRMEDAEVYHKRALQILEKELGQEHRIVGETAGNLGAVLLTVGRFSEAEPLLLRSLKIAEAQSPPSAVFIAITLDHLAAVYRQTGRTSDADARLRQSLAMLQKALPEMHPRIATTRSNLGRLLIDTKNFAEAEQQLKKAIEIGVHVYGPDHPANATAHSNLSDLYLSTGRRSEAKAETKAAIGLLTQRFGATHSDLFIPLVRLGSAELADGNFTEAAAAFQRAVDIDIASRSGSAGVPSSDQSRMVEQPKAYAGLIEALWQASPNPQSRETGRALTMGQWETISSAGLALSALAARFGASDPALGPLVREWQDLAAEWTVRDRNLTKALSQPGPRNADIEEQLRDRLAKIEARRTALTQEIKTRFPRFDGLAAPAPLSIADAQALLAPHEAAVQFYVSATATHVWVITKSGVHWQRIAITSGELNTLVDALRCGLDRSQWRDAGLSKCATRLELAASEAPKGRDALPFSLERAHGLYRILFGSFAEHIKGKDLLIVPSGALTALPFAVLATEPPSAPDDYAGASWLVKHNAITMLPSLASLKALRQNVKTSEATSPFLGVGNPLLTGLDGKDKRAWDRQSCTNLAPPDPDDGKGFAVAASVQSLFRGGPVNVAALRQQPALPETAGELCTVAQYLNATDGSVLLGENASEARLKQQSESGALAGARVVHFATHGLLAGETALFSSARAEPALLLTPPETASAEDDGLLMASEVATLKLDADWVVLSACNTAGGDGAGAESLSGLARAFFYAGARALLVSHWAVDSEAAVKLVTGSFGVMSKDKTAGRAQALRLASLALIQGGGKRAHPAYWAPFVVAGEGGAPSGAVPSSVAAGALPAAAAMTAGASPPETRQVSAPVSTKKPFRTAKPRLKKKEPGSSEWSPKMFGEW